MTFICPLFLLTNGESSAPSEAENPHSFMATDCLLRCLQDTATVPCPQPNGSGPKYASTGCERTLADLTLGILRSHTIDDTHHGSSRAYKERVERILQGCLARVYARNSQGAALALTYWVTPETREDEDTLYILLK